MKQLLFDFANVCDELGIKFFFMIGTALGMYREGNFIQGDTDLDVAVVCSKERLKKLFEELVKNGFAPGPNNQNQGWELNHHFLKYGMLCDVHYQFLKDEEKFFKEFDTVKYNYREFNVPHPIEEYLELNYKNWKVKESDKSRPLVGKRVEVNGGPKETTEFDINKFLECEGRWEDY